MTSQNLTSWYRGFIQGKTRIILAWLFAIVLGLSAQRYPNWPGIVICFIGASLRFWASGYLRKDSRPAVGGPYSLVRNPLYLGTYLMAVGTALAVENWGLFLVISIFFAGIYHYIILDEETKLDRIFGESYEKYKQVVPRLFPRLWPPFKPAEKTDLLQINPEESHHHFSWELAIKNKAYEAYAAFFGLIAFVTLMAFIWQTFSPRVS